MADLNFDHPDAGVAPARTVQVQRMVNLAGAMTSVALVLGVAVWGYKLVRRDITGIPVIQALAGPMRIAPEDPGGQISDHQGLAVNAVAADGTKKPPQDKIILAPRPVELAVTDTALQDRKGTSAQPVSLRRPMAAPQPLSLAGGGAAPVEPLDEESSTAATDDSAAASSDPAPAETAAVTAQPPAPAEAAPAAPTEAANASAPAISGAVKVSLRPMPRPANIAQNPIAAAIAKVTDASATTKANTKPAARPAEVDAASLPVGTRLVQLGAFDDTATAQAEWGRLVAKFGPLLDGKSRVVQAAQSGGRTFYRLRATGFADDADARRFCSALLAENAPCIPVVLR